MAMPVEAKELAVGDWSPTYGTITKITPHEYQNEITHYAIEFFNGKSIMSKPTEMIEIVQGGSDIVHNGMPDKSEIRPGLKTDHAED